jgi:outer membrane assembly lipoprotein YfiO
MADVESGAFCPNKWKRLRRSLAGAALLVAALSGSGCSMIDQFNPFGGADKYKMEITPDVPASKTYDQGLNKLANGSPSEAAKKFTDLGKQYPSSDWARKGLLMQTYADYQAADYTTAETSAERYLKDYPNSPEADYILYLQANSYYMQIPDISRDQEKTAKALETFQAVVTKYPKSEYSDDANYRNTRSPSLRISWPARKCRSDGSISPAVITPPPSIASETCCNTTRPRDMRPKRCIAWLRPTSVLELRRKRRLPLRCSGTISRTPNGTTTRMTF